VDGPGNHDRSAPSSGSWDGVVKSLLGRTGRALPARHAHFGPAFFPSLGKLALRLHFLTWVGKGLPLANLVCIVLH
jgi:hypothetical protein